MRCGFVADFGCGPRQKSVRNSGFRRADRADVRTHCAFAEGQLAVTRRLSPAHGKVALFRVFGVAKDGNTAATDQGPLVPHDVRDVARRHPGLGAPCLYERTDRRDSAVGAAKHPARDSANRKRTCPALPSPLTLNLPHSKTMSWLSMNKVLVEPAAIFLHRSNGLLFAKYGIWAGISESA